MPNTIPRLVERLPPLLYQRLRQRCQCQAEVIQPRRAVALRSPLRPPTRWLPPSQEVPEAVAWAVAWARGWGK